MFVWDVGGGRSGGERPVQCRRGFTLIELLVTISIILVLVSILIPVVAGTRNSARRAASASLLNTVSTGVSQFRVAHRKLPGVFPQEVLGSAENTSGLTQTENALLELSGGVQADADLASPDVMEIRIGDRSVRVNTAMVGSSEGPGYLPFGAKKEEPRANGLGRAPAGTHQVVDTMLAGKSGIPDVLDPWGRPVLMWSRNETAGKRPSFAGVSAPTDRSEPRARFYWVSNRGYLAASSQRVASALGSDILDVSRVRSMDALLGDPTTPDQLSNNEAEVLRPLGAKGDFVLHCTGADGIFLSNKGNPRIEYRYIPGEFRMSGGVLGNLGRFSQLIDGVDDIIQGGN